MSSSRSNGRLGNAIRACAHQYSSANGRGTTTTHRKSLVGDFKVKPTLIYCNIAAKSIMPVMADIIVLFIFSRANRKFKNKLAIYCDDRIIPNIKYRFSGLYLDHPRTC